MTEEEQRALVVAHARQWLGTPFHFEACIHGAGVACGPLLIAVYRAAGIPVPLETGRFPRDWHMHTTEERYLYFAKQYTSEVETARPGDIVLFRAFKCRPFCHGAVVVDWPLVIHSSDKGGVECLDALKSPLGKREMMFLSPWAN